MRKQRTEYDSPVDALIAITRSLSGYEDRYRISSEEFFDKFSRGQMEDSVDFVEWANDYQHYITLKIEIERQLQHVS